MAIHRYRSTGHHGKAYKHETALQSPCYNLPPQFVFWPDDKIINVGLPIPWLGNGNGHVAVIRKPVSQLTEDLERARAERDGVLSERMSAAQSSTQEIPFPVIYLLSKVSSLTEERDQLKVDMLDRT